MGDTVRAPTTEDNLKELLSNRGIDFEGCQIAFSQQSLERFNCKNDDGTSVYFRDYLQGVLAAPRVTRVFTVYDLEVLQRDEAERNPNKYVLPMFAIVEQLASRCGGRVVFTMSTTPPIGQTLPFPEIVSGHPQEPVTLQQLRDAADTGITYRLSKSKKMQKLTSVIRSRLEKSNSGFLEVLDDAKVEGVHDGAKDDGVAEDVKKLLFSRGIDYEGCESAFNQTCLESCKRKKQCSESCKHTSSQCGHFSAYLQGVLDAPRVTRVYTLHDLEGLCQRESKELENVPFMHDFMDELAFRCGGRIVLSKWTKHLLIGKKMPFPEKVTGASPHEATVKALLGEVGRGCEIDDVIRKWMNKSGDGFLVALAEERKKGKKKKSITGTKIFSCTKYEDLHKKLTQGKKVVSQNTIKKVCLEMIADFKSRGYEKEETTKMIKAVFQILAVPSDGGDDLASQKARARKALEYLFH